MEQGGVNHLDQGHRAKKYNLSAILRISLKLNGFILSYVIQIMLIIIHSVLFYIPHTMPHATSVTHYGWLTIEEHDLSLLNNSKDRDFSCFIIYLWAISQEHMIRIKMVCQSLSSVVNNNSLEVSQHTTH